MAVNPEETEFPRHGRSQTLHLFSANGAFSFQLAEARVVIRLSTPNAFGGFKAPDVPRRILHLSTTAMNRAFSADGLEIVRMSRRGELPMKARLWR